MLAKQSHKISSQKPGSALDPSVIWPILAVVLHSDIYLKKKRSKTKVIMPILERGWASWRCQQWDTVTGARSQRWTRVGSTRGSGRVGSGRVAGQSQGRFGGSGRVGSKFLKCIIFSLCQST